MFANKKFNGFYFINIFAQLNTYIYIFFSNWLTALKDYSSLNMAAKQKLHV